MKVRKSHPSQTHTHGVFPIWVLVCLLRSLALESAEVASIRTRYYGFFPVWVWVCLFRWSACEAR